MYNRLKNQSKSTLKPRYNEQVSQTPFLFTISNAICLVNPQNGSLFTKSRNSLYQGSLYRGLRYVNYSSSKCNEIRIQCKTIITALFPS